MSEKIFNFAKTKLLKLIYLLEETSVKKNNLPFFGISFEVLQASLQAKIIFSNAEFEAVKECLKKSSVVKRKIKKHL